MSFIATKSSCIPNGMSLAGDGTLPNIRPLQTSCENALGMLLQHVCFLQ
jgi:hypothetical protein